MNGILFRPWKHKAIRENPDKEYQTRRLGGLKEINQEPDRWHLIKNVVNPQVFIFQRNDGFQTIVKPRYRIGEVVYIKEAWATERHLNHLTPSQLGEGATIALQYKADANDRSLLIRGRWRSPLFMPTWTARDFAKILDVRAERLQSITEEDAKAEGITRSFTKNYTEWYKKLWDSINPEYPWSSNPWCFRYVFKLVE